ncbi:sulfatase-like hydrolase/transferase [Fulvivirgaceae bacterium PWU4]|uniref:Sulfatase-like hydrolase/transferase n=1 Tax=Chryseosolibacter histidini TaxID=2782349 RepID=A0AAP2DQQ6_9BACT|nr:sulfatase-like hydrolase/transferase [Chryseosolibacter histidini]MBT1700745.1 sulfatase-like hydrolase/transferase [Chryseosolibacter histidini]
MKERLRNVILFLVPLSLLFAVVFTLLRVYEYLAGGAVFSAQYEALGFLYDWPFAFSLILFVVAFCMVLALLHTGVAKLMGVVLYTLLLIIAFALIQYFSVTGVPLSADFFGYSFQDIGITVGASGVSILTVVSLVLYVGLFIGGGLLLQKSRITANLSLRGAVIMLVLIAVTAFLPLRPAHEQFEKEIDYNLVLNKSQYFFGRSVSYWREGSALDTEGTKAFVPGTYPFLKKADYNNVLGPFLDRSEERPDLVFLIIEGLGRDFTGPGARYGGFTPFLDSLAGKSLYWKNGLSNAGRTFGALPSILGSLPYGRNGFMSYGADMPDHQTLISLLKAQGYATHFFYGGNPNFDNQDLFLQYQGIDYMLNESNFPATYKRATADSDGFTWGFADRDVFRRSLEVLDTMSRSPRLDIYLTLSTHEPFRAPEARFAAMADKRLQESGWDEETRSRYAEYKDVFSCLLYTDDAIREFFERYKRRPEFKKTIFIITGDHRLIPVPQDTRLSRFHVPIIIYSPLLRQPETFGSMAVHSDIMPALLGLLRSEYGMKFPEKMPFISKTLDVKRELSATLDLALIRNKGEINDYVDGLHFLSEGRLFQITPDLGLEPVRNDALQHTLQEKLQLFKNRSVYAVEHNRVDTVASGHKLQLFTFTEHEEKFIRGHGLKDLKPDELFAKARALAFEKKRDDSRIVLRVLLNESPNYHDARILLARTFAWDNRYDTAHFFLAQVIERAPAYGDAYNALADIEYWKGNHGQSLTLAEKGLLSNPEDPELMARRARGLWMTGRKEEAKKITEAVLQKWPQNEVALDLIKKLAP